MAEQIHPAALITGASRGLGLSLARALASRGWRLVIDGRSASALEEARVELSAQTQIVAVPGDVSDPGHRRALLEAAARPGWNRGARQ
jgi:NAD(P)-dependent dehydrogenase (short-subunit alcohol dehydrogenase family)